MSVKQVRILLAEDNVDHAELTVEILQEYGVVNEIIVVGDGREAMDYFQHRGKFQDKEKYPIPDLVLLDVKMPRMDGFEVLKELKGDERFKHVPVVMLTTSAREEEIAKGYKYGANSYVTKPIDFSEFSKKLKNLHIYWVMTSDLPPKND